MTNEIVAPPKIKAATPAGEIVALKQALELLQEWHDLHCESNRTLDADDTYARTQLFLINTDIEGGQS